MTYEEFKIERRHLVRAANELYSPSSFPGSRAWLAQNAAEGAVTDFEGKYPDHTAQLKADAAAAKAAKAAAVPEPGSLADRITRGVD